MNFKHHVPIYSSSLTSVPCDQRAVLHHAFLNKDALGSVRFDHTAVLVPQHLHVLGDEGGLTLEGQTVALKDDLPLGWRQLEGGQLKRCVYVEQPDDSPVSCCQFTGPSLQVYGSRSGGNNAEVFICHSCHAGGCCAIRASCFIIPHRDDGQTDKT